MVTIFNCPGFESPAISSKKNIIRHLGRLEGNNTCGRGAYFHCGGMAAVSVWLVVKVCCGAGLGQISQVYVEHLYYTFKKEQQNIVHIHAPRSPSVIHPNACGISKSPTTRVQVARSCYGSSDSVYRDSSVGAVVATTSTAYALKFP